MKIIKLIRSIHSVQVNNKQKTSIKSTSMDQQDNQKLNIVPQGSFNESTISNFPSTSSYQHFEVSVQRNSTFVTSKLSLGLIVEKFKRHNEKISEATQNVHRNHNDNKARFQTVLEMYEKQQKQSRQNLQLYQERQALCIEEMKRLENIIRGLSERLYQIQGTETESEGEWERSNIEE